MTEKQFNKILEALTETRDFLERKVSEDQIRINAKKDAIAQFSFELKSMLIRNKIDFIDEEVKK